MTGMGEGRQVDSKVEPGARIIELAALPEPTNFDSPDKLDAVLDAVRWGVSSYADYKNFQASFRGGIEIEDYRLDNGSLSEDAAFPTSSRSDAASNCNQHEFGVLLLEP